MQTDYNTYEGLRAILEKETPILIAQIRALYRELDKKFHLQGAKVPITFGFDRDRTSYSLQQIKKIPDKKSGIAVCTSDRSCDLAGTHTPGTNIHMAGRAVDNCLHTLHIGLPGTVGAAVRVGHPDAEHNALIAKFTFGHSLIPPRSSG